MRNGKNAGGAKGGAGTSRIFIPSDEGDANVISLEERRKKERKRAERALRAERARKRKRAFTALLVIAGLGGVLCALYFVFLIKEVRVEGCKEYSAAWVLDIVGIEPGTHIWLADTDGAKARIDMEPLLEYVSTEREYPSTLVVTVRERLPFAVIYNADAAVTIDITGHILSIGSASAPTGQLLVSGLGSGGYQINKNIVDTGNLRAEALISILADIGEFGLETRIAALDVSNSLAVTMTAATGVTVVVGDATELEAKFAGLSAVLDRLDAEGVTTGTLYLSSTGDCVYSPPSVAGDTPDGGDTPDDGGGSVP